MVEADLATLNHPEVSYDSSIEALLKKRIKLNEDVLNYEKQHFANVDFLFNQGAATFAERDLAKERKTKAELDYHRARFELSHLLNDPNRSHHLPNNAVGIKRAKINSKIKALELQKARLKQILPYDGRIIDIFANEGESISTGTPLYLLGKSDKISVIVYLSPKYAKYARKGQEAIVKLPDGKSLKAKVNMDTNLTRRLPADLSSPIGSRSLMLIVNLDIESQLPDIHWIDGLPVKVRFKSFF